VFPSVDTSHFFYGDSSIVSAVDGKVYGIYEADNLYLATKSPCSAWQIEIVDDLENMTSATPLIHLLLWTAVCPPSHISYNDPENCPL